MSNKIYSTYLLICICFSFSVKIVLFKTNFLSDNFRDSKICCNNLKHTKDKSALNQTDCNIFKIELLKKVARSFTKILRNKLAIRSVFQSRYVSIFRSSIVTSLSVSTLFPPHASRNLYDHFKWNKFQHSQIIVLSSEWDVCFNSNTNIYWRFNNHISVRSHVFMR